MHPSELRNLALVAAAIAERNGFAATAEAFRLLAISCAEEALELLQSPTIEVRQSISLSTRGRLHLLEAAD